MRGATRAAAVLLLASGGLPAAEGALASGRQGRPAQEMQCRTFEGPPGGVLIRYNCQPSSDRGRSTGAIAPSAPAAPPPRGPAGATRSEPARR